MGCAAHLGKDAVKLALRTGRIYQDLSKLGSAFALQDSDLAGRALGDFLDTLVGAACVRSAATATCSCKHDCY